MTVTVSHKKTAITVRSTGENRGLFSILALMIFLVFLSLSASWAQQKKIDSLRSIVPEKITSAGELEALLELITLTHESDPHQALGLAKKALFIAESRKYTAKIPDACNAIGSIYQILSQYDSSFVFHRRAQTQALALHDQLGLAQACRGIAVGYMRLSETDSSDFYFRKELALALKMKNASLTAGVHNDLGNLYLEENKLNESLKEYIQAATLYDSASPDSGGLGKAVANIGNVECALGNYNKGLEYARQGMTIFQKNKNDLGVAFCIRLMGRIYRKQMLYAKALQQYEQVSKLYARLGDQRSMSETHQNMGNIYYDLGDFKKALLQYELSLKIARLISSPKQIAYAYSALGYAWSELHNAKKALQYLDSSLVKAKQLDDPNLIMDAFEARSDIFANQHNYKAAFETHLKFTALKDSLNTLSNKREEKEMEAKYQNAKKQGEINLLQKDRLLQSASLRQHQLRLTALAIALFLIVIISFLLFNRYKIINASRRQLEIERMRNNVARDLHDNIGSTLSSINIISQLALNESKADNYPQHFRRIGEQSLKMMENMSDMVWSINPNNDSIEKMVIRMKEFSAEILEPNNIGYIFEGEEVFNGAILDVEKRKNLFLIFKEAINNAAKYSDATFVSIMISKINQSLSVVIQDNGKGFDLLKIKNGNGLTNMKERATQLGGSFLLNTHPGEGTIIKLAIPIT